MMGNRIKELRKKAGLTQQELAEELGYVSKSSINQMEKGKRDLPAWKVRDAAKVLNTSVEFLFGVTDDPRRGPELSPEYQEALIRLARLEKELADVDPNAEYIPVPSSFDRKLAAAYHAAPDKDQTAVRVVLDIDENGDKRK